MKTFKFLLIFFFAGLVSQLNAQVVIADYDGTEMEFMGWNDSEYAKVENPHKKGINTSDNVAQFSHAGNDWWSGLASTIAMPAPVDFSATPYIKMKVYSEKPILIVFKMENFDDKNINAEAWYQMEESETGKWTEIFFDFGKTTETNLNKVVMFIDPGKQFSEKGTKYYFDDIVATNVPSPGKIVFNPNENVTDFSVLDKLELRSTIALRMIDDSEITDANSIVTLRKKNKDGEVVPFTAKISDDKKYISIKPDELLKASTVYWYGIKDNTVEYYINDAVVNGEQSTFTTSDKGFPDVFMMINFDGINKMAKVETLGDPAGNYEVVEDPAMSGNKVFKYEKGTSWGGWERTHFELNDPIVVKDGKAGFSVKVYSPKACNLLFKISNQKDDGGIFKETNIPISKVEEWETLYVEFSGLDAEAEYKHIFFYPDAGVGESQTYYFDDLKGPKTATAPLKINFNPANEAKGVELFKGLSISSNYILKDSEGNELTDLTGKVALRKGGASGQDVAFSASIDQEKIITITPTEDLDVNTTYWYGIVDNTMTLAANGTKVTGVNATFTTRVNAPEMVVYNNFEGVSLCASADAMGDPAGTLQTSAFDPKNATNTVAQWDKGGSWWGWERIHFELNEAINLSKDKIFSLRVYSPKTTYVRFKVGDQYEESGQTATETDDNITVANEWQTLYFDLSAIDTKVEYKHIFIYIDGGNTDANTFYIDDLKGPKLGPTTAIENVNENKIVVAPNPGHDVINILNVQSGTNVKVFNISGLIVKDVILNTNSIDISNLVKGIYFISINEQTFKFVKE